MPSHIYRSTLHPGDRPPVVVHARHMVRPLAVASLPVMIGTLAGMLEGLPVLLPFVVGMAVALTAASLWTHFSLRRAPAEVHVGEAAAAVRTVWQVAAGLPAEWAPVWDLRDTPGERTVTVGLMSYDLDKREWPDLDAMTDALHRARLRAAAPV